jgi:membrane protein DedA with SNARE-associated domain
MLHEYYNLFTTWLHLHPNWGGFVAFIIAFSESIAIIGSIIPGSVTMTAIGVLAGSGVLPIWLTLICAIIGAIIGDGISYLIGYYYKNNLRKIWPFSKYPKILATGQKFFFQHGGKSVFIGRFVGPIRAIIPIIAGMFNMSPKRYFPISIAASIGWAPVYMLPGILLGAISLEMPADVATELIVFVLLLLVAIWFIAWSIRKIYKKTHNYFAAIVNRKWKKWSNQPSKQWVCYLLRRADRPQQHGQLLLAAIALIATALFFLFFFHVIFHGPLTGWNNINYHLFRGIRTVTLDKIMVVITSVGYAKTLLTVIIMVFAWLTIRKHWLAAIHWIGCGLVCLGSTYFFKHIYFSLRPHGLIQQLSSSSFPSGHTLATICTYGLLAFFATRNVSKIVRKMIYWMATIICIAVAISRMYLGAHWLTDIVGATLLGTAILSFTIISYRRHKTAPLSAVGILLVALTTLVFADGYYLYKNYQRDVTNYHAYWKVSIISAQDWWDQTSPLIPVYRTNRFGNPSELLNIQWAGSLDNIKATLKLHGWKNMHFQSYLETLQQIATQTDIAKHKSFLAKLYKDQHPALELMKYQDDQKNPLIIRLWRANLLLSPFQTPLWVGTIYYDTTHKYLLFFHHKTKTILAPQTPSALTNTLTSQLWQTKIVTPQNIPKKLTKLHPLIQVILVKPKISANKATNKVS